MTTDFRDGAAVSEADSSDSGSTENPRREEKRAPGPAIDIAAYWSARRDYLAAIRKVPELRNRFARAIAIYVLRRLLWSFGFFPIFLGFWVPLVMANFNPVVLVSDLLPALQAFVNANPEVQANTLSSLGIAWVSIGFFFLVFDFILTPFKSPYQYEADVYMRAWERRKHEQLPAKV